MKKLIFALLLVAACRPEVARPPKVAPLDPLPTGVVLQGIGGNSRR
ncbi:MAG: hypothetical protein LH606_11510 [Cytophagaceae bacterium]|nr:hypothetical protein [Cytophagaceae bacterium]